MGRETKSTMNTNTEFAEKVFNYCLENAKVPVVQDAVKRNRLVSIAYGMKMELVNEFPELRNESGCIGGKFGRVVSEAFEKYQSADHIVSTELLRKIDAKLRLLRLIGKNHPDYLKHAMDHDALVDLSNAMQEPINEFLKLYKASQRKKGKKLSIRRK